jgi:MraZ protein
VVDGIKWVEESTPSLAGGGALMSLNPDFCFAGAYTHSLDDKGRLALPSILREELGRSERPDLVMALAYDAAFLTLYPYEHWRKLMTDIKEAIPDTARRNDALRAFSTQVRPLNLDKVGRVLISPEQRAAAGLNREVRLIGVGSKIEIWNAAGHKQQEPLDQAVLDEVIKTRGLEF